MADKRDLIKKEIAEEFTPKFKTLKKGLGIAPAGGSGGKPPKNPMAPAAPKAPAAPSGKKPAVKRPGSTMAPKAPAAPKAPKAPAAPGMQKDGMSPNPQSGQYNDSKRYHIYHKGQKLTENHETVSISDVNKKHGGVKKLESQGFRLVEHKSFKKNEEVAADVMAGYKPLFLGSVKELAKKSPHLALAALPYEAISKAGTQHVIAGEHIPTDTPPPPKPKKVKGKKDEGSGGQIKAGTKKGEIPANKVIEPEDKKKDKKTVEKNAFEGYASDSSDDGPVDEPSNIIGTP